MKVGDYVRTKYGVIARITDIIEDLSIDCDIDVYYENDLRDKMPMMEIPYNLKDEYIVKSSPKIIDLIEEGDLVKYRVAGDLYISEVKGHPEFDKYKLHVKYNGLNGIEFINIEELQIETTLTKEQFESMEYKVGE